MAYDRADLDWEGRQLTRIDIIDNDVVIVSIGYRYNNQGYRISKSITNYTYTMQEEDIYNSGGIQGTALVPNTQNVFDSYDEVTVYISACGWHTFTDYGDLYIEDYEFLGDLFLEVFPSGIYIYSPYAVQKVTGSNSVATPSTTTINYTLSNGLVIYETDGTYAIYYTYDYDGSLISFHYDSDMSDSTPGEEYFYIKNLQGDITAIVNSQGVIQVEYRYDAWGNILYINTPSGSTLDASINPYTYRGYRYDHEIGYYYLNSRFYNPESGRFINADGVGYLAPGAVNGLNLYAYCGNNPVIKYDPAGNVAWWVIGAAIGAVVGAAVGGAISYAKDGKVDWRYVAAGAVAGALVGAGVGHLAQAAYTSATATAAAAKAGGTVISALSADGDPTNEVKTVADFIVSPNGVAMATNQNYNLISTTGDNWLQLHNLHSHAGINNHVHYPLIHTNGLYQSVERAYCQMNSFFIDLADQLIRSGEMIFKGVN